jgi:CheY-like chemotaxis protein
VEATSFMIIVEDSDDDFEAMAQSLQSVACGADIVRFRDGEAALAYLRGLVGSDSAKLARHLIVLDLNLPIMDGRELLRAIKSDAVLKVLPVVVLSTSACPVDVAFCYHHHANGYHIKPTGVEDLQRLSRTLCEYWMKLVCPPVLPAGGQLR